MNKVWEVYELSSLGLPEPAVFFNSKAKATLHVNGLVKQFKDTVETIDIEAIPPELREDSYINTRGIIEEKIVYFKTKTHDVTIPGDEDLVTHTIYWDFQRFVVREIPVL